MDEKILIEGQTAGHSLHEDMNGNRQRRKQDMTYLLLTSWQPQKLGLQDPRMLALVTAAGLEPSPGYGEAEGSDVKDPFCNLSLVTKISFCRAFFFYLY